MKHTRGPWRLIPPHCVLDARGYFIAATAPHFVKPEELRPPEERQANAHLMAAAPRMYDYIARRAETGDEEAREILGEIHAAKK